MKIGLSIAGVELSEIGQVARLADDLGYSSLWYGEHAAVPWQYDRSEYPYGDYPFAANTPMVDPFTLFGYLGGITKYIRLATGLSLLPLRDPFWTARSMAAIEVATGGRLTLGAGLGWLSSEFRVLQRDFTRRGEIMDEFLQVLDRLWTDERPEFHGRHFDFEPIGFEPKTVQKPRVPVFIGGMSEAALRRAAQWDGWFALGSPEEVRTGVERIKLYRSELGREDQPFEVSAVNTVMPVDQALLDEYAEAGADELVVTLWHDPAGASQGVRDFADEFGLVRP